MDGFKPMTKKLLIFGAEQIAELSTYYFEKVDERFVDAFVVDKEYLTSDSFLGKPVICFDDVVSNYSPEQYDFFIAISYQNRNASREKAYEKVRRFGYKCASFVHPSAVVWEGFKLNENVLILENNTVQPFSKIGVNSFIWSNNHIGHHSIVGDHCFMASEIVVSGNVQVGDNVFIGVNATLGNNITIGNHSIIGAGTITLKNVEPNSTKRFSDQ
jgi:sugar O-acyltransferase (sialic acid O-acetyltransferase NeuD family)